MRTAKYRPALVTFPSTLDGEKIGQYKKLNHPLLYLMNKSRFGSLENQIEHILKDYSMLLNPTFLQIWNQLNRRKYLYLLPGHPILKLILLLIPILLLIYKLHSFFSFTLEGEEEVDEEEKENMEERIEDNTNNLAEIEE